MMYNLCIANYPVIVFDPGGDTGFAALTKRGKVIDSFVFTYDRLRTVIQFVQELLAIGPYDIVIEIGPQHQHHSPVTRRVEAELREAFPKAHLVQPSQWKSHPVGRSKPGRKTRHENDAVRLGHWFQARSNNDRKNTTPADADST